MFMVAPRYGKRTNKTRWYRSAWQTNEWRAAATAAVAHTHTHSVYVHKSSAIQMERPKQMWYASGNVRRHQVNLTCTNANDIYVYTWNIHTYVMICDGRAPLITERWRISPRRNWKSHNIWRWFRNEYRKCTPLTFASCLYGIRLFDAYFVWALALAYWTAGTWNMEHGDDDKIQIEKHE